MSISHTFLRKQPSFILFGALWVLFVILLSTGCTSKVERSGHNIQQDTLYIDRASYSNALEGFWLGTSIGNWTGLVTEMDKIGDIGEIKTGAFYTREDWGKPDEPNIWDEGQPSQLSETIDFVLRSPGQHWGADDDTDIEYMYQYLMLQHSTTRLTPQQIQHGWLSHIATEEENYLWVSNQRALDLMAQGYEPPQTGSPDLNEHTEMIDAQLTTELFGLFAPGRPDIAREIAHLPIRTVAREETEEISLFYVTMFALAALPSNDEIRNKLEFMASVARDSLSDEQYPAKMYDYVFGLYQSGISWEAARDSVYEAYQIEQRHGYDLSSQNLYCNGCFAGGINFAASLISLFYGEGDLLETIRIGSLAGWDSDNPTATWAGLLGFMMGADAVEAAFGQPLSRSFHIHRTRQGFPNDGYDTFPNMAKNGLKVIDMVVSDELDGRVDAFRNRWAIPLPPSTSTRAESYTRSTTR